MSAPPIICFGQQPCGFFPRRFLAAKIFTARRLQQEIGGEIVFFLHDSDHDPRETHTTLRDRHAGQPAMMNFAFMNKIQRKWSPQYRKQIPAGWQASTARQLGAYVDATLIGIFKQVSADNVADFCLAMYRGLGLLDGVRVVRSSDPAVRDAACNVSDFYVDVAFQGETVRARHTTGVLQLHEGGNRYVDIPVTPFSKSQVSPTRDTRLAWMQSVIHCTHYIAGAGEQAYLRRDDAPEITFLNRDPIDRADEAYIG